MTFAERLQLECAKNGLYANGIVQKLGFSKNAFTYWKKTCSKPSDDKIVLIAKELGLSKDEFMEGVDGIPTRNGGSIATVSPTVSATLSQQEQEIIQMYRAMGIKKQMRFLQELIRICDDI